MKKILINILKFFLVFIILISLYFILLTISSLIPSSLMKENVKESADYFLENGGEKEIIQLKNKNVVIFNFTTALMVNTAYSIDSQNPIESFLVARKNYIPGVTKKIYSETSKSLMSASKYYENGEFNGNAYQTIELYDTVNENELYESFEYARYWHGYLVYLRPILVLFNYNQINILSNIVFYALLITCSYLIYKKIGIYPAIALIIACLYSDLIFVTKSINEIICFDLALLFSIFILLKKNKQYNITLNFFIIGSITNFIDFLTNPIVVYGIPIIIYFTCNMKDNDFNIKDILNIYLKTSVAWFLGYSLTWCSKWIIADALLNKNIIKNAIEQIGFRTDINNISKIDFLKSLKDNISNGTCIFIYITLFVLFFITLKNVKDKKRSSKKFCLVYFISALIPMVWYFVLLQHSFIHIFFTYRNTIILIFATEMLVLGITNSIYRKNDTKS